MRNPEETRLLSGLRVLDLADGVAGPYAAKLLGELGAEVIKVGPPCGDSARTLGPFPNRQPDPERSGMFMYLNAGKQLVILDPDIPADREKRSEMTTSADVVVANAAPTLDVKHSLLVVVCVTPFGQTGPLAGWRGNDLIAFHSSGFAFGFPALEVDNAGLPPLNAPTYAAEFLAGRSQPWLRCTECSSRNKQELALNSTFRSREQSPWLTILNSTGSDLIWAES